MYDKLSRLERRIMDAVYHLGKASVPEVVEELDGEDIYHSIRVTMSNLERKGFLKARRQGPRNLYEPTVRQERARKSAVDNLLRTFFDDSPLRAALHFLNRPDTGLSQKEIAEIRAMIRSVEESNSERR